MVAAVLAVLLLTAGGGTAALASAPSSPFFGVRVALEEAEVLVTPNANARLELRLAMADRRAAELEAMAGTANLDEIALAAQRYESALSGEVDEVTVAPDGPIPLVDQRLASQEETLGRAAVAAGSSAIAERSVEKALSAVARERSRLRERRGQDVITSPAEPTAVGSPVPGGSAEASPSPEASATPEPSATAVPDAQRVGQGQDQGRQERSGWEQPSATATEGAASSPVPSASPQERNRQQGPASPSASPTPKPASGQPKPGGQVGTGPFGAPAGRDAKRARLGRAQRHSVGRDGGKGRPLESRSRGRLIPA